MIPQETQEALLTFRNIFWDSFHRPALQSPSFIAIWEHLESINNVLAGPFYAIYDQGNCDYIFNDKKRFLEINEPDDLLNWCVQLIEKYKLEIENFTAETEAEIKDKKLLLYQTDLKMELADLAYIISQYILNK